jgi:hypothetical protein
MEICYHYLGSLLRWLNDVVHEDRWGHILKRLEWNVADCPEVDVCSLAFTLRKPKAQRFGVWLIRDFSI